MSRRSLSRVVALVVVPAMLIGLAVYGAASIERTAAQRNALATSEAEQMLTAMLDQETGARGYYQTRDEVFLGPWYKGRGDFTAAVAAARLTDAGDATLEGLLRDQVRIAQRWQASAAQAIAQLRRTGRGPTTAQALSRKSTMDDFRAANAQFAQVLRDRGEAALSRATLLAVLLVAGLALALAAVGLLLLRLSAQRESRRRRTESELRELLQVSESESESRTLLIRYIERGVPAAHAAVLNRNNSDDRLELELARGERAAEGPLSEIPDTHLQPRSCLAVRLSRAYVRRRAEDTIVRCDVCGKLAADITCEPLLVGGTVIGSVLVASPEQIPQPAQALIRDAVVQAAPIIANQRNLSLAETRAASDSLTGLPNRRSADDTLKRMAAHAGRRASPLTAILLDLDHFKQINDVQGHEQGDQALAMVGRILGTTLRASDFAARVGGEEFLVLLPDTGREPAAKVAEKLRAEIAAARGDYGALSASFGVACLPEDAAEPEELLRKADRALYLAKRNGRNRVELASSPLLAEGAAEPESDLALGI